MNCGYETKWSYDPRSYERNFCNCVKKPEKFRTSTGFEPVTLRYRCDALNNWAMKPLTLGAGHLWVLMFPWGMNQRWNDICLNCEGRISTWSDQIWIRHLGHPCTDHEWSRSIAPQPDVTGWELTLISSAFIIQRYRKFTFCVEIRVHGLYYSCERIQVVTLNFACKEALLLKITRDRNIGLVYSPIFRPRAISTEEPACKLR